ncbi:protein translocase subunit SecD [Candidatus Gracilibacteria bacterium]|nr:protein translocase subunit SecD [Candidatus Gracilibacteria bacterium]MCF7819533.1 protein translocase subunit SecD [Candidatus Gracilibacteria bacterium]
MRKQIIHRFLFVIAIAIFAFLVGVPSSLYGDTFIGKKLSDLKITLGLDLAGGTELDYRIDLSEAREQNNDDDPANDVNLNTIAESVRDSLEQRVNPAGVGEIVVKRSQVEGQEHVIIQMPPSSNVEEAKQDAERDNRLEFFEEDPTKVAAKRLEIAGYLDQMTAWNWDVKVEELTQEEDASFHEVGPRFEDQIGDQELAERLFSASEETFLSSVVETQTEADYTIDDEGNLQVTALPKNVLALIYVSDKETVPREKTLPPKAHARHILFAYPDARRAGEDVPYESKEEAQSKAEEILTQLREEGTENFEELAKEFSTENAAQRTGGDLGTFEPGKMVAEFNDAVFAAEEPGLLDVVESPFGFHVIEVLEITPEQTTTENETQITYEMLAWNADPLRWEKTELDGAELENATVGYDEIGQPLVNLLFDDKGADLFAQITERVSSRRCNGGPCRLGIKVGGQWITQPTVREKIIGRSAQITGQFTFDEAKDLADGLNLGAIDAPVTLSGQTTITPELGTEQLQKSLKAGLAGFIVIMIFIVIMYRFAGVIAAFSLSLYAGLFLSILKIWPESFGGPIVLTLAGIAGIILSIGLAVDGNILIFERLKEELRRGRGLMQAVDLGFERAWPAIRDSNLTTLLTCVILFSFGSSIIKGFAITLIVGTLLSMFTAITISRTLLRFSLLWKPLQKNALFGVSEADVESSKKAVGAKIRKR